MNANPFLVLVWLAVLWLAFHVALKIVELANAIHPPAM